MPTRIVVTGLGFTSCIGNSTDTVHQSLLNQQSGITAHTFCENPNLSVKAIGKPKDFEFPTPSWRTWKLSEGCKIDPALKRSLSPHGIYAFHAVTQAIADSKLEESLIKDGDTGLYCASAGSPMLLHHNLKALDASKGERGNPLGILSSISGTLNFNLGSWFGIRGTNCGFVSACTSSSHAIGYAFDDIALGRQKRAIVVGAEDATAESLLPFAAMRALSTNPDAAHASRPFDKNSDGFVGAGGAVTLILEEEQSALERGAPIYAELKSWGQSSDGYHRASPHPKGEGLASAINKALKGANITPDEIDYVNAHATSTLAGDQAEAAAIRSVFSTDASSRPLVSSTKGLTGHGLSMAGTLEAAICCLAIKHGFVPGNAHLKNLDPNCEGLNIPRETQKQALTWVLNNSSGFGGSNVCHVFKRYN